MNYPESRMRRYRSTPLARKAAQDIFISPGNFIQPLFVTSGAENEKIPSMPGVERIGSRNLRSALKEIEEAGIPSILVFPIIPEDEKDETGSSCYQESKSVSKIVANVRKNTSLNLMVDLCLCPYTTHGHCGLVDKESILNDETLEILGKSAVSLANAGADWVAPSGMIDGMVSSIRSALDQSGNQDIAILSYSIKFASGFYGPFREAAHSAPKMSDRKSYQMDYRSGWQIERELAQDIAEGADAVMVKPALPYLDVIRQIAQQSPVPVAAYQVSGEYSMIMNAAQQGLLTAHEAFDETFYAFRRAKAQWIISYFALEYCKNTF